MKVEKEYVYIAAAGLSMMAIMATFLILRKRKKSPEIDLSVFDSPDAPGSGRCIDRKLVRMLQQLERTTRYPVFKRINSGVRTSSHNSKVGGVYNSSHKIPVCNAVDISTPSRAIQRKLVEAARKIGFKRIGIGSTFIHLDIDGTKSQYVAWGYPSGTRPPFNPFA